MDQKFCNNKLENGILCGAFGCVVKVEDTDTSTHYAGKISIGNAKSEESLQKEYEILKKLNIKNNPHMIRVKELCDIKLEEDYNLENENGKILANLTRGTTYKITIK
jgi:hypothetical protein